MVRGAPTYEEIQRRIAQGYQPPRKPKRLGPIREFRRPKRGQRNTVQNAAQAAILERLRAQGKQGKPKMGYIAALKVYNVHKGYVKGKNSWCVPTKGTKGSSDIKAIMMHGGIPESMLQQREKRTAADWAALEDKARSEAQFGAYAEDRTGRKANVDMVDRMEARFASAPANASVAFGGDYEDTRDWSTREKQYSRAVDPVRLRRAEVGRAKFRKFARPDSQFLR